MLAVRWHGPGDVRLEDIAPPPPPAAGEVQLAVSWCGICGTDIEEIREGPIFIPVDRPHPVTGRQAPLTMGHEFSGVVVGLGTGVEDLRGGDRVACDTIVSCGSCEWCLIGEVTRCDGMGALGLQGDGGLAELCNIPARLCMQIPDGVSDDAAALTEPLSVGVRALHRGRFAPGERVAVIGAGPLGLLTLQAALAMGAAAVVVVEPSAQRRHLAAAFGAVALEPGEPLEVDLAIEAAGNPEAVESALGAIRTGGRAILMGIHPRPSTFSPLDLVLGEKEIIGSLGHVANQDFRIALDLLGEKAVRAEPVISDRVPLEDAIDRGVRAMLEEPGKHMKILVGGKR